ncbi:hypothetical protein BGZ97_007362, partial [Linnemannia gamsii]
MRSKKSLYTDADMDMLGSESDRNEYDHGSDDDQGDPAELLAELGDSGNEQEPFFSFDAERAEPADLKHNECTHL